MRLRAGGRPPRHHWPGRAGPAEEPPAQRRDASCLPRVTQPRLGWRWQPPVPSLPGLNPRWATRPCRHSSPRRRSPEMMWPRPVTPTTGHPRARAELPPRQRFPPVGGDGDTPVARRGRALAGVSGGERRRSRRGRNFPSPPPPFPGAAGPAPAPPRAGSRPRRRRRAPLCPAAPTCGPARLRLTLGWSCPARISPAAQPRASPHTPEPPGTGCGAGSAGSCSPAAPLGSGEPRPGELQAPASPEEEGLGERGGACAGLPERVSVSFLACGGSCPELLTGRRGAAGRRLQRLLAFHFAAGALCRPCLASPAPAASSRAKTGVRARSHSLAVAPAPASRSDRLSALPALPQGAAWASPLPGPADAAAALLSIRAASSSPCRGVGGAAHSHAALPRASDKALHLGTGNT